eukprot:scaffold21811_cov17-Tisochrysis_lutea.AAC.5
MGLQVYQKKPKRMAGRQQGVTRSTQSSPGLWCIQQGVTRSTHESPHHLQPLSLNCSFYSKASTALLNAATLKVPQLRALSMHVPQTLISCKVIAN